MGCRTLLITSTVKGILAQRLVRRLCKECSEPYTPSIQELKDAGLQNYKDINAFRSSGCLNCRNTGYKGRIGIYELLLMDNDISDLILKAVPAYKIREQARKKWDDHTFRGWYNQNKKRRHLNF